MSRNVIDAPLARVDVHCAGNGRGSNLPTKGAPGPPGVPGSRETPHRLRCKETSHEDPSLSGKRKHCRPVPLPYLPYEIPRDKPWGASCGRGPPVTLSHFPDRSPCLAQQASKQQAQPLQTSIGRPLAAPQREAALLAGLTRKEGD
ncbi:hypothetical protein VTI28DRAFT_6338 [Corynascus sepedonium]